MALPGPCWGGHSELLLLHAEVVLLLAHVPVQALRQALEPVAHRVPEADGGQGVAGGSDADTATAQGTSGRHSSHENNPQAAPSQHGADSLHTAALCAQGSELQLIPTAEAGDTCVTWLGTLHGILHPTQGQRKPWAPPWPLGF